MSHHGEQPFFSDEHHTHNIDELSATNEKMRQLFVDAGIKLGATGEHPEGKLKDDDDGEIRIAIGHTPGKVVMDFGEKPIKWIGFNPVQARQIAMTLMEHADECLIIKA
jgi:hypothetical protein